MKRSKVLRKTNLALVVSATTALVTGALPGTIHAQDSIEEITITGSRIVRRDLSAPSPIMTVGSEQFENSSTTSIESVLNQMPQFVPDGTQFDSSVVNTPTSTPGAATLNLRGLGSNRNLVLIDGRRAQPTNAALVVDINTIPAAAIQNVEVITGGASAVYGPDAMAGVVNFMLKDNFQGVEFDLQTGRTAEGDGEETRYSMLMGMNADDGRGNLMIGLDWTERKGALQRDRSFYRDGWADPMNPSGDFFVPRAYFPNPGNGPSQAAVDSLFPGLEPGTVGTSQEIHFNEDGSPFVVDNGYGYNGPYNCIDCGPFSNIKKLDESIGGNLDQFGRTVNSFLSTPLERHSVFMRGSYDLSDNITAVMQANYSNIEVIQRGPYPPAITVWQAPSVPRDGRDLPGPLDTLLDSRPNPDDPWALFQVLDYNGQTEGTNTSNVWQMLVGLEGQLMDGAWTWDVHYSKGDTKLDAEYDKYPSLQRYQDLVYASDFGRVDGYAPPRAGRGYTMNCTSGLPVFEDFPVTEDCLESIDTNLVNRSNLSQEIFEANIQGGLGDWFELPAGEVQFALGTHWRANEYQFMPGNPLSQTRDNPIGTFASNSTGGKIDVTEVYGELLVPVLEQLDLELGYRYSDFSTAGGQDTYKALFTWAPNEMLTFRGGFQLATRAPNPAELFTAPTQETIAHPDGDLCSVTTLSPAGNVPENPNRDQVIELCRALIGNDTSGFDTQTYSITGIDGPRGFHRQNPPFFPLEVALRQGNPDVGPEEGETFTLGTIITDPFGIPNLTVTADWYQIELSDAINPFQIGTVYDNCFNADGASNPDYDVDNMWCQMIRRNPVTGDREEVDTPFANLGTLETSGLDLTVNWSRDIGPGVFNINTSLNYLDNFEYQLAPDDDIVDATGTLDQGGLFDFRGFTTFSYAWSDFSVGLTWRHLSSVDSAASSTSPDTTIQGTGSYDVFNASGTWNLGDRYSFRAGIDNLFDKEPPSLNYNPGVDSNTNQTNPGLYDVLGRRYYVGVSLSF